MYTVGDMVWLNWQNIKMTHLMKKLDHKGMALKRMNGDQPRTSKAPKD